MDKDREKFSQMIGVDFSDTQQTEEGTVAPAFGFPEFDFAAAVEFAQWLQANAPAGWEKFRKIWKSS